MSDHVRSNLRRTGSRCWTPALPWHAPEVATVDRLTSSTDDRFQPPGREEIAQFFTEFATDEGREVFTSGKRAEFFGTC